MGTSVMEMSEEQRSVLSKVEKLFRLAGKAGTQEEAASATAKAQELLLAYNLDAAAVGSQEDGRRGKELLVGGFYQYERDLWSAVAELNFCLHWVQQDWVERPEKDRMRKKVQERYSDFAQRYRKQTQQHLVGKRISVETTKFTISYLKDSIERLTREHLARGLPTSAQGEVVGLGAALRSRRAVSFREGIASNVVSRLWEKRWEAEREERKAKAEAEKRAAEARERGEVSSETALTISSVRQSERDANMDVLYGEGWSQKQRDEQARRAKARKEAEEEEARWAAAHPEEARKMEEERRREERKASKRRGRSYGRGSRGGRAEKDRDWGAYYAGQEAGQKIGLDPQTEHRSSPRKIGHG